MTSPIFDLQKLEAELDQAESQFDYDNDQNIQSIYLGTVFSFMPSGKFYTFYARSNVTDQEIEEDEAFIEQANKELETIDCWLEAGEGDPCDLYVCRITKEIVEN